MPGILFDTDQGLILDELTGPVFLNDLDGGFKFNGDTTADDQIAKALNGYLQPQVSRPFVMGFWIYIPAAITSTKEILSIVRTAVGAGQSGGFRLIFSASNNSITIRHGQDNVSNQIVKTFINAYNIGWNYIWVEKAQLNTIASYKLYLNNNEITNATDDAGTTISTAIDFTTIPNFIIGANPLAAGRTPNFFLKDFKFIRRSLNSIERAKYFYSDGHYIHDTAKIIAKTGTITATNGNTAVTGSGTSFTTECTVGEGIYSNTGTFIGNIATINSNTSITLEVSAAASHSGAYLHGSLVLDLRLNEKGGTSVADSSGLANTFTKSGSSNTTQGNAGNAWRNSITLAPW
jgi:hypothetical protein